MHEGPQEQFARAGTGSVPVESRVDSMKTTALFLAMLFGFGGMAAIPACAQLNSKQTQRELQKSEKKQEKAQKKYRKAQKKAEKKMLKTERKNSTHYKNYSYRPSAIETKSGK